MSHIIVYAQFPVNPLPDAIPADWEWRPCLKFPVDKLVELHFSSKPFKWIRFATGIVVGARGDLSSQQDMLKRIDYSETLPDTSIELYYHVAIEDRFHMFPLDPQLVNTSVSPRSATSSPLETFWDEVMQRDEEECVLTGYPSSTCDAAHILSHGKGDSYIEAFTRGRDKALYNQNDIVRDIDSVRNGLLLTSSFHAVLGLDFAVLVTPNFAMDTDDVEAGTHGQRYTAHCFDLKLAKRSGVTGRQIRTPQDMSQWPPTVLFDAAYASAVFRHFGIPSGTLNAWKDEFYLDEPTNTAQADELTNTAQADEQHGHEQEVEGTKHTKQHNSQRRQHFTRHKKGDARESPDLLMVPYMYVPKDVMTKYAEECRETAAQREHEALEAKVSAWRDDVCS
ncbi:hypothetical protein EVG20_g4828 [Dentipellis fragilis]|uniref:HNH nuclease domain-containing protein n=1 Tax=Dentipellis fragilis TaxID=205917 RepID=A0A4Y9YVK4_9AGAM|nr:hypothetical protein EVG20_g4828 [Dentipellis fragilis]